MRLQQPFLIISFFIISLSVSGQTRSRMKAEYGKITQAEADMKVYSKDTIAAAVVLFESGKNTFEVRGNYIRLIKVVHRKIKVFDAKRYDGATIAIPYYNVKSGREKIAKIKAMVHNYGQKRSVAAASFFDVDVSERWAEKRFTFPEVQDGSILEYTYTLESPYFFNFGDWEFQGKIPKIYSEFAADIPGNYVYNRSLVGTKKLDVSTSKVLRDCLNIPGFSKSADCESSVYGMYDVPSYESEPYMLAVSNYISRLSFEMSESTDFEGQRTKYSKTWEDVDTEFRKEKDIGRQLKQVSFFRDVLPEEIKSINDVKERAKAIYSFIQNHYTWNGEYRIFSGVRVKDAWEAKSGNIAEINISLVNALRATGIDAKIAMSSTRKNGLPSSLFPVLLDYNYVMGFIQIDDVNIFLDASSKTTQFGLVPFKALNSKARVMDFKNGSYWEEIIPELRNIDYIQVDAYINDDQELEGTIKEVHSGYKAKQYRDAVVRKGIKVFDREDYAVDYELFNTDIAELDNLDKPLKITQELVMDLGDATNEFYLNPMMFNFLNKDVVFEKDTRQFPIDLGYPFSSTYIVNIDLKDTYEVVSLPESKTYALSNNSGSCALAFAEVNGKIQGTLKFKLSRFHFPAQEYEAMKTIFDQAFLFTQNTLVKLKKK